MTLAPLGWTERLDADFRSRAEDGQAPARVVGEEKGFYRLLLAWDAEPLLAEISGKMRHAAKARRDYPAVGDWVVCHALGERAVIHSILPRSSCLTRKEAGESSREQILATNVDSVLIVTSANQDLNPRRLERYLTVVRDGGAEPAVILNKIDLVPEWEPLRDALVQAAGGAPVFPMSVKTGLGLEQLAPYLQPGRTCVLLGSSGVGKSTLTNRLLGREKLKTKEVRAHDDRGVHTTTSRYLIALPAGGMIIDTPGLRELQLTSEQEEGLQAAFAEIEALALRCKFTNCRHENEPSCAIRAALETGALDLGRWKAYLKLQGELQRKKGKTRR